jgi:two-component system NtrC family response regulator/two-component system nitrogen regulation response regulator GlnG
MAESAPTPSRAHILIVEDSSVFREMQGLLLRQAGFSVAGYEHPDTALAAAKERKFDLVVIDYELPGMNGQKFMHKLREILPTIKVIFVSGSLTLELAVQLSREGVAGIFNKPANPKILIEKINETLHRGPAVARDAAAPGKGSLSPLPAARRANSNSPFVNATTVASSEPSADELAFPPRHFVGTTDRFRELTHRLWKVRDFRAVLLLQGEAGSPFEFIARDLAAISIFRDGPVMVCAAPEFTTEHLLEVLAPTLLAADAGTLVVTGVETFTSAQQSVLKSLLASRDMFLPFARRFRVVLAVAGDFAELADSGRFDETLYYKISSLSVTVPALREMRADILPNLRLMLDRHAAATKAAAPFALTPAAAAWIEAQPWPGNYSQLWRTLFAACKHGAQIDSPVLEAHLAPAEEPVVAAPVRQTRSPFAPKPAAPAPAPVAAAALSTPAAVAPKPAGAAAPKREAAAAPAPLTARGLFKPAASGYSFTQRLTQSLASADALAQG